ncbi:MAG: hypothetical protein QOJ98_3013 [Acidobacteriota bacterium]|nr:hypothetical protein [Acidobacteriota bacterium]
MQCANSTHRRASCLTIHNDPPSTVDKGIVEVENCELRIGDEQVGLLVINTNRASIRNNRMRVIEPPQNAFNNKVQDLRARSGLVNALISGITFRAPTPAEAEKPLERATVLTDQPQPPPPPQKKVTPRTLVKRETNVQLLVRDKELRFTTEPALVKEWQTLLAGRPPQAADEKAVIQHVRKLAEEVILGQVEATGTLKAFLNGLQEEVAASASQGIAVAGTVVHEVTITGNTLSGVSQGIHVGVSHHDVARTNPDRGGRVVVTGNHVDVHAVIGATRSRHAIFVGNADSIVVRDNYASLTRFAGTSGLPIDGIRLFGYFGRYMNVRENHVERFGVGILVHLRGDAPAKKPMWQIHDNFTANATQSVLTNHNFIESKGNIS